MATKPEPHDHLQINSRLYRQLGKCLDVLEDETDTTLRERIEAELSAKRATDATLRERIEDALASTTGVTVRERIAMMSAVAQIQKTFMVLRREDVGGEDGRGSAVRKYSTAFQRPAPHAARRGKAGGRSAAAAAALADDDDDDADPDGAA